MPKRGRPPKPEGQQKPTATIRVDAEIARMLQVISAETGEEASELVSPILKQPISKRYFQVMRERLEKEDSD